MNILVANLGSTSFKVRLFHFDGAGEASLLAKGGYERVADQGKAIDDCLAELRAAGHLRTAADLHGLDPAGLDKRGYPLSRHAEKSCGVCLGKVSGHVGIVS